MHKRGHREEERGGGGLPPLVRLNGLSNLLIFLFYTTNFCKFKIGIIVHARLICSYFTSNVYFPYIQDSISANEQWCTGLRRYEVEGVALKSEMHEG